MIHEEDENLKRKQLKSILNVFNAKSSRVQLLKNCPPHYQLRDGTQPEEQYGQLWVDPKLCIAKVGFRFGYFQSYFIEALSLPLFSVGREKKTAHQTVVS